jgi:cytochrome c peroxidase
MQGSTYDCRGKPGDGADYDAMAAADQEAVTRVTVNTAKAMAAYVRQLRCGPSRFDQWLDGDDSALDASERRGAALFVGRAACVGCHSGPNLTDHEFHNVGLAPAMVAVAFVDENDRGAAEGIEQALGDPLSSHGPFSDGDRKALPEEVGPELEGAFRTPSLRCISSHPSFMHTGQIRSLEQAVSFHDRGGDPPGHYPGVNELRPLGLTESERADLVAFIRALDGPGPEQALLEPPSTP